MSSPIAVATRSPHRQVMGRVIRAWLFLPWIANLAQSQVSQRATAVQPAPGAVRNVVPTPVATAALPGLLELSLPQGSQVYIRNNPQLFVSQVPSDGISFRREVRNGQLKLVATLYQPDQGYSLKATYQWVYPGSSRLVYTGPWVVGKSGWYGLKAYFVYLLRPIDDPILTATPRATIATLPELNTGKLALAGSNVTARTEPDFKALLSSKGCDVKFVPETVQQGTQIGNLVCLLLQDGQAVTTGSGLRLFGRSSTIEIWKGDQLLESASGLLVRDGQGRHWLLGSKGYY